MVSLHSLHLALACVFATPFLLFSQAAAGLGTAPGDIAAYIVGMRGEAEIHVTQRSDSGRQLGRRWIPAEAGYALRVKDSIRTGRGRVRFEFTDRNERAKVGPSVFNLGDNTEVHLADYNVRFDVTDRTEGQVFLDLIKGTIRSFIKGWGGQSGFSVRAGVAVCGVRGTEFSVRYVPEEELVEVVVEEGEAVLTGPGGSRLIKAGERSTMIHGEFSGAPPT